MHDIAAHPTRHQLALTASKDESIRLWHVESGACVAVFKGEGAHGHEVISLVRDARGREREFYAGTVGWGWGGGRVVPVGFGCIAWSLCSDEPLALVDCSPSALALSPSPRPLSILTPLPIPYHQTTITIQDWHPWREDTFASAGMDPAVKVWSLARAWDRVEASSDWRPGGAAFKAAVVAHPVFSTQRVREDEDEDEGGWAGGG